MAFPSAGVPTVWRNNRQEVRRFLDERHGKGWRVWNFRPKDEGEYDEEDFYGRGERPAEPRRPICLLTPAPVPSFQSQDTHFQIITLLPCL